MISDEPTEITSKDIDDFVYKIMNTEMTPYTCFRCGKKFYFESYGGHVGECDECWFSRFPKEEREAFFRSFFE